MKRFSSVALLLCLAAPALADPGTFNDVAEPVATAWAESDYTLPTFPKAENLTEFYVSSALSAKFYIDQTSISTGGADNVVRYAMVVKTSGGATNISYEGLRCDTSEYRIYATGNDEGTWAKARRSEWRKFAEYNKQQKSLANIYFCPGFNPIKTADEGRDALKRGAHPIVKQRYE